MSDRWISAHVSLNGRLIPREQATISVFNQALFSSFGVYESIEVDAGVLFHLDDHIERLFESARIIELSIGRSESTIRLWVTELIERDQITEALLRIMVFGPNGDETLVYILPMPLPHYPSTFYTHGAAAITFKGCRALPQAKTLNTLVNYLAQRHARSADVHEAFLVDADDNLTEGSRSNLFVVAGGQVITPPTEKVLSGITRELVWKLAEGRGLRVSEGPVPRAGLAHLEEMFVTSTSMHIIPIVRVDDAEINHGHIGPITRLLMNEFETYYAHVLGRVVVPGPAID
jgi:branched-chain amino acid aminotransferase